MIRLLSPIIQSIVPPLILAPLVRKDPPLRVVTPKTTVSVGAIKIKKNRIKFSIDL